jgi:hypothetical protein
MLYRAHPDVTLVQAALFAIYSTVESSIRAGYYSKRRAQGILVLF